jgi:hypothetical protein
VQQRRELPSASACSLLLLTPPAPLRCITPPAESEPARQQLLAGCLLLLGAPLAQPGALASNVPAAGGAAGGPASDELWQAATATGCRLAASGGTATGWVGELLGQGDWGWLCPPAGASASAATATQEGLPPPGLRAQPWYRADPGRRELLVELLTALARGPARSEPGVASALLALASEAPVSSPQAAAAGAAGAAAAGKPDWGRGRALAKQLLGEQRTNLVLWQASGTQAARQGLGAVAVACGR